MATFFTDFSEYAADAEPSDWTERWDGGSGIVRSSGIPAGGGPYAMEATGEIRYSWDAPGAPTGDVDVLIRWLQTDAFPGSDVNMFRFFLHGHGEASPNYYHGGITTPQINPTRIYKTAGVVLSILDGDSLEPSIDTWYWLRLNRTENTLRMKIWPGSHGDEPETWLLSETDSSYNDGFVGFYRISGDTVWIDYIGVGTDGDPAPVEISEPVPDAPTGLSASSITDSSAFYDWDTMPDTDNYIVQRRKKPGAN